MAAFQLIAKQPDEARRYLQIYFDGIYQNQIDETGEQVGSIFRSMFMVLIRLTSSAV
jgi:hypothetical protein